MLLIVFVCSLISAAIVIPMIREMLIKGRVVRKNYNNIEIPVGMGIALIPVLLINTSILLLIPLYTNERLLVFLIGILTMAFVGIIDDLMGDRNDTGFRGHFGNLLKGKLTTGGLKAVTGGLIGFFISIFISSSLPVIFINTILIALMTNLLNLFDLRPGRALKVYLIIGLILLLMGITMESKIIFTIILGYCIIYLPQDLKARSMMGDVGSNTLGMTLGIISAVSLNVTYRLVIIFLLLTIHIVAEKYSLTKLIKKVHILDLLDQLGR